MAGLLSLLGGGNGVCWLTQQGDMFGCGWQAVTPLVLVGGTASWSSMRSTPRNYAGYKQEDGNYEAKSLAELENQRNSNQQDAEHGQSGQLYSPSPARKGDSSLSAQKGSDTSATPHSPRLSRGCRGMNIALMDAHSLGSARPLGPAKTRCFCECGGTMAAQVRQPFRNSTRPQVVERGSPGSRVSGNIPIPHRDQLAGSTAPSSLNLGIWVAQYEMMKHICWICLVIKAGRVISSDIINISHAVDCEPTIASDVACLWAVGQDYEICPYATFSLPGTGKAASIQNMDYYMQFQTFGQQECYSGQPQASRKHYSHVRGRSSASCTSRETKLANSSNSPPDGLSLGKSWPYT
ncbi:hypothetical protein PR048_027987 [Dryococelus australis]|uniref:Uncharacterized protein n=1 Tax=Dryococelus australis TaxID=614101 RepID=A0ABQ9GI13_9NEOP|nr:hypothetical protein PR048_027987 [Dryococelus australis]